MELRWSPTYDCLFCKKEPLSKLGAKLLAICYGTTNDYFLARMIDGIIYKENTKTVVQYKEMLYFTHEYEYLNKYYTTKSSIQRLTTLTEKFQKFQPRFYINNLWGLLNKNLKSHAKLKKQPKKQKKSSITTIPIKILKQEQKKDIDILNKISSRKRIQTKNVSFETTFFNIYAIGPQKPRGHLHLKIQELKVTEAVRHSSAFLYQDEQVELDEQMDQIFKSVNRLSAKEKQNQKRVVKPSLDINLILKQKSQFQGAMQSLRATPSQSQRSLKQVNSARNLNHQQKFITNYAQLLDKYKIVVKTDHKKSIDQLKYQRIKEMLIKTDTTKTKFPESESDRKDVVLSSTDRPKWQNEQKKLLKILNSEIDKRVKVGSPRISSTMESLLKIQSQQFSKSKRKNHEGYGYWTSRNRVNKRQISEKNLLQIFPQGSITSTQQHTVSSNNSTKKRASFKSPIQLQNFFSIYRSRQQKSDTLSKASKN